MVAVTKYLVLYRSKMTAEQQMGQSTPGQAQAGMDRLDGVGGAGR